MSASVSGSFHVFSCQSRLFGVIAIVRGVVERFEGGCVPVPVVLLRLVVLRRVLGF